jgi:fructose-1,6-bisphosphatase/inositol monophosphatase family enzyme
MTRERAPLSTTDLTRIRSALEQAAAEEIMPRFGNLGEAQIRRKASAFDVVTEADEAAERAIIALLKPHFPEAVFIGEEGVHREPALLDLLGTAELCFLIDPLDGTRNFASSIPLFGVMAAAVASGEVVAGVIHDPVMGGSSMAVRGGGAFHEDRSGVRSALKVAAPVPLAEVEGIVGTNFLPEPLRSKVASNLSRLSTTNWFRCAAHEYRLAAAGHCHVLFYNKLMPWDHAAGWLIHREAGGFSAHFDGSAYLPVHRSGGLLCAPDEASWIAVRDALLQ